MLRCPASVFKIWMAVPLLASEVKNVRRPLWLLARMVKNSKYLLAQCVLHGAEGRALGSCSPGLWLCTLGWRRWLLTRWR